MRALWSLIVTVLLWNFPKVVVGNNRDNSVAFGGIFGSKFFLERCS